MNKRNHTSADGVRAPIAGVVFIFYARLLYTQSDWPANNSCRLAARVDYSLSSFCVHTEKKRRTSPVAGGDESVPRVLVSRVRIVGCVVYVGHSRDTSLPVALSSARLRSYDTHDTIGYNTGNLVSRECKIRRLPLAGHESPSRPLAW